MLLGDVPEGSMFLLEKRLFVKCRDVKMIGYTQITELFVEETNHYMVASNAEVGSVVFLQENGSVH